MTECTNHSGISALDAV